MLQTKKVFSGAKWEEIVGYSRAIQAGNVIEVAGTTAINEKGEVVGINNPYVITRYIIQIAEKVLKELGADLTNVIRTRIYTTDIFNLGGDWQSAWGILQEDKTRCNHGGSLQSDKT
ncbi:MAG: hypothetical protein K8R74_17555 [Bacteroidales bacterium]|nr:hypothetical protein [Bacteroidales bacterium]